VSTTDDKEKNTIAPPNPLLTTPTTLIGSGHDGTIRDQFNAWTQRIRGGEMGMLPALGGFLVLIILFSFLSPFFLTPINMANLLTQTAALAMLAIALTFVILLAEIDLSAGVTGGVGMASWILLVNKAHVPWVLALIIAFAIGAVIGAFIGYFVAKVGIPSFVVTLGLFLGFQGLNLVLLGDGGLYRVETPEVLAIMSKNLQDWQGWVLAAAIILITFFTGYYDRRRRQKVGVAVRPFPLLLAKTAAWAVFAIVAVALLNQNRSTSIIQISGVPIVVPLAIAVLWVGTMLLDRSRFGLHLYAVGGNPEAARRAGINVARVRIAAFMICSTLAVASGLFSASQTGTIEPTAGKDIVLQGVAAAVVGGVSLFGGRGKIIQAAVGALVISSITNGLGLLGLPAGITFLVTGGVLVLAATVDAVSRRRSGSSSLARG
jgi:D-xylose transport system permease protein